MFVRRSATALAGISVAGLAATVLAIPAHANTDVTVTSDGWVLNTSYPSTIDVSAITASEVNPTPITFIVSGPATDGLNNQDVSILPFETDAGQPKNFYLYADEALTVDCQQDTNCVVTSNGTAEKTVYVNPDPLASCLAVPAPPGSCESSILDTFRVAFKMQGILMTFDGSETGLTVTYGAAPTPDPGGGGDDGSGSAAVVSGPGPHIQQFPVPATGTCDEAQPEGLNWGGVSSGGWSESWSWWMHDGEGGHVCTRTLAYNTSMAAWEVD